VAQALRLGMTRVACVSTGNTSASMAAYSSAAGLQPVIFIPHGNIAYGKLAQALEYGARTLQVEANFDQILALVMQLAKRVGIYLLNPFNPFRIEGQKPSWLGDDGPARLRGAGLGGGAGGNLGNTSAFGKALREMRGTRADPPLAPSGRDPGGRVGAILRSNAARRTLAAQPGRASQTLATAIRIGDPSPGPKLCTR